MHEVLRAAADAAEHAEVFHLRSRTLPIRYDSEGLSSAKLRKVEGVAVRVIADGKLGYATSTNLMEPTEVARAAAAAAQYGESCLLRFPSAGGESIDGVSAEDVESIDAETLAMLGESIHRRLVGEAPGIEVGVNLETAVHEVRVTNTEGVDVAETRSYVTASIEATRAQADDILILTDGMHARSLDEITVDAVTARCLEKLRWAEELVAAPSGPTSVIFTPSGALALLFPLAIGLSGKSVLLGMSPLADKLGTSAFDRRFGLSDDGRALGGTAAGGFDDEGVETQNTPLVDGGVVRNFYYDLRTAQQADAESTGNGYKGGLLGGGGFRPAPGVGLSNLLVTPGTATQEELLHEVKDGLLVDTVIGLGQGNLNAGDFSNNVSVAFRIKEGRIVGRVKNLMISGNTYKLLADALIAVGNDARWIYGRLCIPSIAVRGVHVSAK